MRALITGIGGFVGGFLSAHLEKNGLEVWGTVQNESELERYGSDKATIRVMDLTKHLEVEAIINEIRPDMIYHLAAQSSAAISWDKPQLTIEVNVNGTINLLEAIRKSDLKPRILIIGSSEEYGFISPTDLPVSERQPYAPGNPYAVSKIAQSYMSQVYANAFKMHIVITRSFNHIGPGQSPAFVVSDFAKRIAEIEYGRIEPILKVGNLEAIRDFTDVRDIVVAYATLMKDGISGEVYNIGTGKGYSIDAILQKLMLLSRKEIRVEIDSTRLRPADIPIIECDNTKIKHLTGWQPIIPLEKTLQDVLNYWRTIVK